MADRYWVGGTGTWNFSSTANWSASSGGASGASVPTAVDSVFFDQAATYTVTLTGALTCLDFTVSAGTVTFASSGTPTISGSMSLIAGTIWTANGTVTFNATTTGKTITTNGVSITGQLVFNGAGGVWTLGSALTTASNLIVLAGTFDTSVSNYAVSIVNIFQTPGALTRNLNLNGSTITVSNNSATALTIAGSGFTFNAGTSTIVFPSASAGISSVGATFYNVSFTSTTVATRPITGANTFNNLSVTASSAVGVTTLTFSANQTINGALTTTGTAGNRRVFFTSTLSTPNIGFTLTVNSAASLTDADFRDIYVIGTAAPISGTRIGNRGNNSGITFSTAKTVYWNLAGAQNWSANGWATTSAGTPSTDNFPLPQDTATFTNAGSVTGTITLDTAIGYCSTVDMSGRTTAMTIGTSNVATVYGNWTNGSGTAFTGTSALTFSGGTTQTITSASKTFTAPIIVDTYGGTIQLADALNIGTTLPLNVLSGTFTTADFNVTAGSISSNNSTVRSISLGASTLTLGATTAVNFSTSTNLTLNAGTSQINLTNASASQITTGAGFTFYNLSFTTALNSGFNIITGVNTFNNLTFTSPSSDGISGCSFSSNQTINGTLTCAGASIVRRILLRSSIIGTQRTLTVNSLSATDCDFRDIAIAGAASGSSPTRAGDCGNNSGITFPAAKTVYWNLGGAVQRSWASTAWATSSGGIPDVNNFPLAQDTAIFDDAGAMPTSLQTVPVSSEFNLGSLNSSARTAAGILQFSNGPVVYNNFTFGTGITCLSVSGGVTFAGRSTQTITSNGVQFGCPITINNPNAYVQLADALSLGAIRSLTVTTGTFDAVTYNVTIGLFSQPNSTNAVKMGSGTWTLSGTGTVWSCIAPSNNTLGTSTIVLSDTSTNTRTFTGGNGYYNKLTIGGATGISSLFINSANTFGELASTKTVAHTIIFGTNVQIFGRWSVTGTVGNVVTISGTATTNQIYGPAVTGVDYLVMGTWGISTSSPGEFYAGANSTGTAAAPVFRTAAPAPRTLYWVGGTGNWSATTSWSTSSGGASGAAIPTSRDAVNFDSLSNATAYTATIDAGVTIARCTVFSMAGPLVGNVTWAGTVQIALHGNFLFAATGITNSYTGTTNWAGDSSYTITANGRSFNGQFVLTGPLSTWTLGSALISQQSINVNYGTLDTSASSYGLTSSLAYLLSTISSVRSILLNASTVNVTNLSFAPPTIQNLIFNAGTSQINMNSSFAQLLAGGATFYNVSFLNPSTSWLISGTNTFNNLTFTAPSSGVNTVSFSDNQTINGTFTINAPASPDRRTFLASSTIGTARTLTVNAFVGASDIDFRDITVTGSAAPLTGTRFGNCLNNSGITFDVAKTVYWNLAGTQNWNSNGWALASGGAPAVNNFPLAQDTAIFDNSAFGSCNINFAYNIPSIDGTARTSYGQLSGNSVAINLYGDLLASLYMQISFSQGTTFVGQNKTVSINHGSYSSPNSFTVNAPGGTVQLTRALQITNNQLTITAGTFITNNYNYTGPGFSSQGTATRVIQLGSSNIISNEGAGINFTSTGLTITGTGTFNLTYSLSKNFQGGGASFSGMTLNQGGIGTLSVSGNNTFASITKTAVGATTISFGTSTQRVGAFTATGTVGNLLTLSGSSAGFPANLIYTGSGVISTVDYLVPTSLRVYPTTSTWFAGANSTNGGSLGWIFTASGGVTYAVFIIESATALDSISAAFGPYSSNIAESNQASNIFSAIEVFKSSISETVSASETNSAKEVFESAVTDTATALETNIGIVQFGSAVNESITITDLNVGLVPLIGAISESAQASEQNSAKAVFTPAVSDGAAASEFVATNFQVNSALLETAQVSAANASSQGFGVVISESATANDTVLARAILQGIISEAAGGSDQFSTTVVFLAAFSEFAQAYAEDVGYLTGSGSISESSTVFDSASAASVLLGYISESTTVVDSISAKHFHATFINESAQGLDAVDAPGSIYNATTSEQAAVNDSPSANAIFYAAVLAYAGITDIAAARYLWELIDDTQIANWSSINDTQSAGWVEVNDIQAASWQNVGNTQSSSWTEINDTQNPNWERITP